MNHNKDREYQYDALGRLIVAKGGQNGGLSQQSYQYDRFGNRTSVTAAGVAADNSPMPRDGIANLSYNTANNRITTPGYEYDAAGNQTKAFAEDGTTLLRFEYDAANRLVAVRKDADNSLWETQDFGVGNDRISQTNYSNNQRKYYYGSIVYTETNNNGSLLWSKSYVSIGGRVLTTITPNGSGGETIEYNHPDKLGTKVITNPQAGTSVEQNELPFGTKLDAESSGQPNSIRFTSYERSPKTGLDYAQNRTYDSKQGRFTQVDPIGIKSSSLIAPQTLNLYTYCINDPINKTDPDGQFWGAIGRFFKKLAHVVWVAIKVVIAVLVTFAAVMSFIHGDIIGGLQLTSLALHLWGDIFHSELLHKMARILSIAIGGYNNSIGSFSGNDGKNFRLDSWFPFVGSIINFLANYKRADLIVPDDIIKNSDALKAMYCLLKRDGFGMSSNNKTERAAWIIKEQDTYDSISWPWSAASAQETWKGEIPDDAVAIAHTHPKGTSVKPSTSGGNTGRGDQGTSDKFNIPIYTITRNAIWKAVPNGKGPVKVAGDNWWEKFYKGKVKCD